MTEEEFLEFIKTTKEFRKSLEKRLEKLSERIKAIEVQHIEEKI